MVVGGGMARAATHEPSRSASETCAMLGIFCYRKYRELVRWMATTITRPALSLKRHKSRDEESAGYRPSLVLFTVF